MKLADILFDEDVLGDVVIDFEDVFHTKAVMALYQVQDVDGNVYLGTLDSTSVNRELKIIPESGEPVVIPFDKVYSIAKFEKSFWSRFDGSISLGSSFTKSSDIARVDFDANTTYKTPKLEYGVGGYLNLTAEADEETTQRAGARLQSSRILKNRLRATARAECQRNTELGLNSRINLALLFGKDLNKQFHKDILFQAGLNGKNEWDLMGTSSGFELELPIYMNYQLIEINSSGFSFFVDNMFYIGLTEDRYRDNFSMNLSYEVIEDLIILLSNYIDYDSAPPSEGSEVDWGYNLSIGYTF